MKDVLLNTKLHIPAVKTNLVPRPGLIDRLKNAEGALRLVLLSAPAGYGKTTLIGDWLSAQASRTAWLSLDENDNDLSLFLTYLIAAVQQVYPALSESGLSLLKIPPAPPVQTLATWLINDLAEVPFNFVLVLEDYHVIQQTQIHDLLDFILNHQPPNLLLVLASRQDPPFSLARLRARGQMCEIRADDLRFNQEETFNFFNKSMSLSLDHKAVKTLADRTEGWVAGLQLAALSMQGWEKQRINDFVENFSGSHRYVIDYLLDEVIQKQRETIRDFLYATAYLERLNAPLCDAVMGRSDSRQILTELERDNLFLVALDEKRQWYRYQHLFADSLRAGGTLSPTQLQTLHLRAAAWFEENGWPAEAIRHYAAGQEVDSAARLIAELADDLIRRGELVTLLGWLNLLPETRVLADQNLAAARATALLLTANFNAAVSWIKRWQETDNDNEHGKRLTLMAWLAEFGGSGQVMPLALQALEKLPQGEPFYRMLALIILGSAYRSQSNMTAANQVLRQAVALGRQLGYALGEFGALDNLVFNLIDQGELREARALCEEAMQFYVDHKGRPLPVLGMVYIPYAQIYFVENDLFKAQDYARRGLSLCRQLFSSMVMGGDAEAILALSALAEGRVKEAYEIAENTRLSAAQKSLKPLAEKMDLLKAMLALRCNDLEPVRRWLEGPLTAYHASDSGQLLQARYYLQTGQGEMAVPLLKQLALDLEKTGKTGRLLNVYLLSAWAYTAVHKTGPALDYLTKALKQAELQGYRRSFYDLLPVLRPLLPQARPAAPRLVDELLAVNAAPAIKTPAQALTDEEEIPLVEMLSERELEILGCIHEGLTNDEIAARLVITQGTVKWHVSNIYGKLNVKNRTQALARARRLRLMAA